MSYLYLELGLFIIAAVLFVATFFMRKPGVKGMAGIWNLGKSYTPAGVICYVLALVCLFAGLAMQLSRRM
jgi:hypothetical protein